MMATPIPARAAYVIKSIRRRVLQVVGVGFYDITG
tara:strand:- start:40 stop:144 length:105 start_codon:yes stop_codon:yes gene_type:complete